MESQVRSYAKYIGLDLDAYPELLWIAEEGLRCPLPQGWVLVKPSGSDGHYFRNTESGASSVDHPMDQHYRTLVAKEVGLIEASRKRVAAATTSPSKDAVSGGHGVRSPSTSADARNKNKKQRSSETKKRLRFFVYALVCLISVHFILTTYLFNRFSNGMTVEILERTITTTTTEQWLRTQNRTVFIEKKCTDGNVAASATSGEQRSEGEEAITSDAAVPVEPFPAGAAAANNAQKLSGSHQEARPAAEEASLPVPKESSPVSAAPVTVEAEEEESLFSFW